MADQIAINQNPMPSAGKNDPQKNVNAAPAKVTPPQQAQVQPENPLDQDKTPDALKSDLLDSIIESDDQKNEQILDEAPIIDKSLLADVTPSTSPLLIFLKMGFGILALLSIFSFLFFRSQLNTTFDFVKIGNFDLPNISQELSTTNQDVFNLKNELNLYYYIATKAYLDQFSYFGDIYIQNYNIAYSQTSSGLAKQKAKESLPKLKEKLALAFNESKEKILTPIYVNVIEREQYKSDNEFFDIDLELKFKDLLTTELNSKATELANSDDAETKRDYKNYANAKKLVGNAPLKGIFRDIDFEANGEEGTSTLTDKEVYLLVKNVNDQIINDLTIVQQIKDVRIVWSEIINEIDYRTMVVDKYFNKDRFDQLGGIKYSSYGLDTNAKTISVIGEIKRFDTINFTMITNLIDELNNSGFFGNAEMRSFQKSGSLEDGYKSSVRFTLNLKDYVADDGETIDENVIENEVEVDEEALLPIEEPAEMSEDEFAELLIEENPDLLIE
jgi:hypothetical protein